MTATIGTSGGNKAVNAITVGTSGGNKSVSQGWIGTASGNRQFYSSGPPVADFTVELSGSLTQDGEGGAIWYLGVTANVSRGGSFSYDWGDGGAFSSGNTYNQTFFDTYPGTVTVGCTVTDTLTGASAGNSADFS